MKQNRLFARINMTDQKEERRARARELAADFASRGDVTGWFEEFYREASGDNLQVPWADLKPNRFFRQWAETNQLTGDGRRALVVGCGLGDDARFLFDIGFDVTAFDISPTAIDWAKQIHSDTSIRFETADLFDPDPSWAAAFDFVLEIYTIQPLPIGVRPQAVDAVSSFVADDGSLVVVCRGREDDEEAPQMPWPLSLTDLSRFEENGLVRKEFHEVLDDEDEQIRFIVKYDRPNR